ncbi:hypothetical protein ISF_02593 [Cordyceps fumosorosea ARSEF 2679]|uniref:Uncharacterized protein n=1 Tax=Cordyceps fumosorosea (strain ARSEF 2679) TaxID=1081104 RepID=A0A162MUF6_CORFA|nr:hypothetical protein ISF_02593 [Cordyceps fumosorosea ARSEF 2679]OAA70619.1 hypothetical protein ISF_02593 [Cordyceps fumosorosea ARSEF 2679]
MAPANGSSKPRKAASAAAGAAPAPVAPVPATTMTTGKPAQKKPVVPALPLPYVKRHAAVAAPASQANKAEAKAEHSPSQAKQHKIKDTKPGKDDGPKATAAEPTSVANGPEPAVPSQEPTKALPTPNIQPQSPNTDSSTQDSTEAAATAVQTSSADASAKSTADSSVASKEPRNKAGPKPRPPPAVSPTRYNMPPPFQPGNRMPSMHANDDGSRGPRPPAPNGHAHVHHQAHPSNSSLHFGVFHESQSSSPAPPHSGGIAPPPGMPYPAGRQPFVGPGGNGFPPMMPYGPDMMPVTTFDNYGRPSMAYAPPESYPPYRNTYNPSTPQSFHDSHSSMEEFNQQQFGGGRVPMRNGGPVPEEQQMQGNAGRMFAPPDFHRMIPNPGVPPQIMRPSDDADHLAGYAQQQFGNPELSDCSLELRYLDDRAPPVRIAGHRFILNRSPELASLLRQQIVSPSPPDRSQQTVLIETNSKWIRSDSFYMAAQRLYGLPLLQYLGPRNHHTDSGEFTDAGSIVEQLDFALSYAAAGQLIGWAPITKRGCEVSTQLIDWQTIERVLEFALEGHRDQGTHDIYRYGEGSKIILDAVVTFIVHNFPPTFELDTDVIAPVQYARLPMHSPPPSLPTAQQSMASLAGEKPVVQLGKGRRSQKLTNIQFGDLTLTESNPTSATETPKASRPAQPVSHSVLSRILLNIPFTQLKMILESAGSGNVNGWANAESRYRIVKAAVDEREARRIKAVDAVVDGRVLDADALRAGLRAPEPRNMPQWGALGWHEEMLPYGNPDGPSLGRKWAPLPAPQGVSIADYP